MNHEKLDDIGRIELFGHVLIRDKQTGEVLVNQRETMIRNDKDSHEE